MADAYLDPLFAWAIAAEEYVRPQVTVGVGVMSRSAFAPAPAPTATSALGTGTIAYSRSPRRGDEGTVLAEFEGQVAVSLPYSGAPPQTATCILFVQSVAEEGYRVILSSANPLLDGFFSIEAEGLGAPAAPQKPPTGVVVATNPTACVTLLFNPGG